MGSYNDFMKGRVFFACSFNGQITSEVVHGTVLDEKFRNRSVVRVSFKVYNDISRGWIIDSNLSRVYERLMRNEYDYSIGRIAQAILHAERILKSVEKDFGITFYFGQQAYDIQSACYDRRLGDIRKIIGRSYEKVSTRLSF